MYFDPSQDVFATPISRQAFFKKFFSKYFKRDIEKMYRIKFVDLQILRRLSISWLVFET